MNDLTRDDSVFFFWGGYKSWINTQSQFSTEHLLGELLLLIIRGRKNTIVSVFEVSSALLGLFCAYLNTSEMPMPGRALKNASVSTGEVHSIPRSAVNFPKEAILFPSLFLLNTHTHGSRSTDACTRSLHACALRAHVLYLSLCWANTPLSLACFFCHDDERHLLFSAESLLHPM